MPVRKAYLDIGTTYIKAPNARRLANSYQTLLHGRHEFPTEVTALVGIGS